MVESKPTETPIRCSLSEDFNQSSDRNDILATSGVGIAPILGISTPALSSVVLSNSRAPAASQVSQYPNRFFNFSEPSSEHDRVCKNVYMAKKKLEAVEKENLGTNWGHPSDIVILNYQPSWHPTPTEKVLQIDYAKRWRIHETYPGMIFVQAIVWTTYDFGIEGYNRRCKSLLMQNIRNTAILY